MTQSSSPNPGPKLVFVVARARNGVIGAKGGMPWHIPSELALFKRLTLGKPTMMGRKTWDGLYVKPLPGRPNLVLSRDPDFSAEGVESFTDFAPMLARARELAERDGADEMAVIGGMALFDLAMPHVDRMYLTEVELEPEGDVIFPAFDESHWRESPPPADIAARVEEGAAPVWRLRVLDRIEA